MPPPDKKPNGSDPESSSKKRRKKKKNKRSKKKKDIQTGEEPSPAEHVKAESAKEKKNPKQKPESTVSQPENPLFDAHQKFLKQQCTTEECDNFFSNALVNPDRRGELWMQQADVGEALVNQYAWAIPDERAIRILKHFSPLVEIGCGANAYWAKLLSQAGVDIVAYDRFPDQGGQIAQSSKEKKKRRRQKSGGFQVQKGGPEVLGGKKMRKSDRTLFLCYTDEEVIEAPPSEEGDDNSDDSSQELNTTSLGTECLRYYQGDYVILVGELYESYSLSMEQAPWGRSFGGQFQQQLAATFHCVLRVSLPNWIHVRDTLSVWKRSETCSIVFAVDSDDEDDEGDLEVHYRHIPVSERLPTDVAAPCLAHMLDPIPEDDKETKEESSKNDEPEEQSRKGVRAQLFPGSELKKRDTQDKTRGSDKKQEGKKKAKASAQSPDYDSGSESDSADSDDSSSIEEPPKKKPKPQQKSSTVQKKQKARAQPPDSDSESDSNSANSDSSEEPTKKPKPQKKASAAVAEQKERNKASTQPSDSDSDSESESESDAVDSDSSEDPPKKKPKPQKNNPSAALSQKKKQQNTKPKPPPPSSEDNSSAISEDEVLSINDEPEHNNYAPEW